MAFEGSSFNLWEDSDLTEQFSGTFSLVHQTDLSDNPQDLLLYLGSPLDTRQLQSSTNPGVNNITLSIEDILPEWESTTSYVSGDRVQPVSGNGFVYQCTTSGTSDSSEPSWPVSGIGSTVVDGTAIWSLVGVHHPTTEIKLALTSGGLTTATGGQSLSVGNTVTGGTAGAVEVYIRVTNTVTTVTSNTGHEEIAINISSCIETAV